MIILGIDPGYDRLGYALLEKSGGAEELMDCGCLRTGSREKYESRVLKIADGLEKIFKKYRPDALAVEKVYFAKNQKTALRVSEIKGVVIYLALKNGLEIFEFSPLEVKLAVCGYGRAEKFQIKKMADMILDIKNPPKLDDTYDAIALCLACSAGLKQL